MREKILSLAESRKFELNSDYLLLTAALENLLLTLNERKSLFRKIRNFISKPKGFYIYGGTGCGKTTIMNTFFENISSTAKINIHFHDYFLDISKVLIHISLPALIKRIAQKIQVLCFDEFYIENIADARLLQKLLKGLIKKGVIIVLTSNFAPESLYEKGFNRELIFPDFSIFLRENMNIFHLSGKVDFRNKNFDESRILIKKISSSSEYRKQTLIFENHIIECVCNKKEAIFEHKELFSKTRGISQYIYIARKFDIIYIKNFIIFTKEREDEIIRFRNFIDICYLRNTIIFLETADYIENIFPPERLNDIKIKRTLSRLKEMSSLEFISETNLKKRMWSNQARDFFTSIMLEN